MTCQCSRVNGECGWCVRVGGCGRCVSVGGWEMWTPSQGGWIGDVDDVSM